MSSRGIANPKKVLEKTQKLNSHKNLGNDTSQQRTGAKLKTRTKRMKLKYKPKSRKNSSPTNNEKVLIAVPIILH